ncbi:MAG: PorP/SprF family type IX secretion system membrane protein [Bacteroidota bacterium]
MKTLYSYCKGFGVFLLLSLFVNQMNAQDIHFSQFGNSPMNLSPALTGMFGGDMRFVGNYRSQWNQVPVSYLTFSGAYDMKFDQFCSNHDQWAGGILFNYDVAGDSKLHTAQLGIAGSYTHRVNPQNFLTLGLLLSGYQRGFSTTDLLFDNQWNGRVGDPNLDNGETFANTNLFYGDFSAGLNWRFQKPNSQSGWDPQNRTKLDVGASVYHINRPDQSFYDEEVKCDCYMRYNVYGLGTFRLANPFDLVAVAMYQTQGPHTETVLGIGGKIHLDQRFSRQLSILLGLNVRLQDALIPNIEVQYNAWRVGVSYDVNTSDFNIATNNFGGPEVSVAYIFVKPKLNVFKNCNPIY